MPRWLILVVALGACNQVLGLDRTQQVPPTDAKYFDAPADAPYACPPIGQPPKFSSAFHQFDAGGNCTGYTRSTDQGNIAMATCEVTMGASFTVVEEGEIDKSMMKTMFVTTGGPFGFVSPVVAPDGDQVWVNRQLSTTGTISVYDRSAPGSWTFSYDAYALPPADSAAVLSPPTRPIPVRHLVYVSGATIHELVESAPTTWSEVRTYRALSFTMTTIYDARLSPDGLRMVFSGVTAGPGSSQAVRYSDRASVDVPFVGATSLDGPPSSGQTPFMTEDCSRVYFSGVGSVFYVAQL
jgi:hypothetical protein